MPRNYRIILEVDLYVEGPVGEDDSWDSIEYDIEEKDEWDVFLPGFGTAYVNYIELDSYVEE